MDKSVILDQLADQLMQYPIALILMQIIAICLISIVIQGIFKNIVKFYFPQKHKIYLFKKVIYPIAVLIQGTLIGYFTISINHILWKIIVGSISSFWATNVYSMIVDLLKDRFKLDADRNTILSLIPLSWETEDKEDTEKATPKAKRKGGEKK